MERFGKFQLLEKIGEGGMAEIFLARPVDAALSKLVAVKRILSKFLHDRSFEDMFRREGEIALRFRHPAIITVYEMGTADGFLYMSMEYFPGKTLAKIMSTLRDSTNKPTFSLVDKVLIVKTIADALKYIHEFSDYGEETEFIHRDISPHNIMVGFSGETKLIDFGIAKDVKHETTQSKYIKGKIAYMSPEQVRGNPLTKQTDIFSLGIVLWEILAEKKLFTGKTIKDITDKVKGCEVPPLKGVVPDIAQELNDICMKALSPDLETRYSSASDFATDIDYFLRRTVTDNHLKSLAKTMHKIFPDDVKQLKEMLKKYEGTQQASIPQSTISTTPTESYRVLARSTGTLSTSHRRSTYGRKKESKAPSIIFAVGISAMLVAGALLKFSGKKHRAHFATSAVVEEHAEPPVETTPVMPPEPQQVVKPEPPPPPVQKAKVQRSRPQEIAFKPVKQPEPKPVVQQTPPQPKKKTAAIPAKPKPVAKKTPPPKPVAATPPAKKSSRKLASKPTPPVKPASPPAIAAVPKAIAYLTVLADPKAAIIINGKKVGIEVVNEIKVPADQVVSITVVGEDGTIKAKEISFKPLSRNVIEMDSASGQ